MAGQPRRRRQREADLQLPPDLLKPRQPAETVDQLSTRLRRELRQVQGAQRERDIRAGRAKPRTMAETEIFASDLKDRRTPNAEQVQADPE
jgi:hypothetical protein